MLAAIVRAMLNQRLLVVVIALGLCAAGVIATKTVSVDAFPDVTNIQVQIATVAVGRSPEETLSILDGLQTDELCPCNRAVGGDTLRPAA